MGCSKQTINWFVVKPCQEQKKKKKTFSCNQLNKKFKKKREKTSLTSKNRERDLPFFFFLIKRDLPISVYSIDKKTH